MAEPRLELRSARGRATAAVVLDAGAIGLLLVGVEAHQGLVAAVGAVLVVIGLLAVGFPRLGLLLTPFRALELIVGLVGGLIHPWLFSAGALGFVAVLAGITGALRPSFAPDASVGLICDRCGKHAADLMMAGVRRRPLCTACATRRDEIGSAMLMLGLFVLTIAAAAASDGPLTALIVATLWPAYVWSFVAVHEAGHAIAAHVLGNQVRSVVIGVGLRIVRVGVVSVHALPVVGLTEWRPNEDTMTARREALIIAAGPAGNLVAGAVLLLASAALSDSFLAVLAAVQGGTAVINLVPWSSSWFGHADGARLYALLRGAPVRGLGSPGDAPAVRLDRGLAERAFRWRVTRKAPESGAGQADGHDDEAGQQHQA